MLNKIKGDLITLAEQGNFDVIVHGCNCQTVMGGGIAKQLKLKYPIVYDADILASKTWTAPVAKLGNFSTATILSDSYSFIVINAYTQLNYGSDGKDYFDYASFEVILKKLRHLNKARFGFPMIGMGLAGGDSSRILPLLEDFAKDIHQTGGSATLVEYSS